MSDYTKVGQKKDFPLNMTKGVKVGELEVCIAHTNGGFYAFENQCTHAASLLSDSDIEDGEISCPLHGARFNVTTGEAITLPAVEPLKTYEVKVEGDEVLVKV